MAKYLAFLYGCGIRPEGGFNDRVGDSYESLEAAQIAIELATPKLAHWLFVEGHIVLLDNETATIVLYYAAQICSNKSETRCWWGFTRGEVLQAAAQRNSLESATWDVKANSRQNYGSRLKS